MPASFGISFSVFSSLRLVIVRSGESSRDLSACEDQHYLAFARICSVRNAYLRSRNAADYTSGLNKIVLRIPYRNFETLRTIFVKYR